MVLALIALAALGQVTGPMPRMLKNSAQRQAPPLLEFAPLDGAGMGAACACAAVTASKGETMTFSRSSSATCLKGNTTSGIANGDMVTCGSGNRPRVMPGGDGSGALGVLVEGARTNAALRSEEFDNAAWTKANSGCAAMTVTADAAVAPDGNTTADRLQIPSCSAAQYSHLEQVVGSATRSASVFVKGNGTSGTIHLTQWVGSAQCISCSFNPTTWTRCLNENMASATQIWVGADPNYCSGQTVGALDVFVWGADSEAGSSASSYISTTSASVTRSGELADIAVTFGAGTTGVSLAATVVTPSDIKTQQSVLTGVLGDRSPGTGTGSANYVTGQANSTPNFVAASTGMGTPTSSTGAAAPTGTHRFAVFHTGAALGTCIDGTCGAGSVGTYSAPSFTRLRLGNYDITSNILFGVNKLVCVDPSHLRCR